MYVKPKKGLGQHFLTNESIAKSISDALLTNFNIPSDIPSDAHTHLPNNTHMRIPVDVLEVGPGTGVLTKYLLKRDDINLKLVEIDTESIEYLREYYPEVVPNLLEADFLKLNLSKIFSGKFFVIGNFPYNISSQIFFKVLDNLDSIPQVVGMVQKEVAERIASPAGNKSYGILSVLLQAWYNIEYLFTVDENDFNPPPKVKSAVIRLTRNSRTELGCDPILFKKVVKTTFNQRRKQIRNSIREIIDITPEGDIVNKKGKNADTEISLTLQGDNVFTGSVFGNESLFTLGQKPQQFKKNNKQTKIKKDALPSEIDKMPSEKTFDQYLDMRPEQLTVDDFISLTLLLEKNI